MKFIEFFFSLKNTIHHTHVSWNKLSEREFGRGMRVNNNNCHNKQVILYKYFLVKLNLQRYNIRFAFIKYKYYKYSQCYFIFIYTNSVSVELLTDRSAWYFYDRCLSPVSLVYCLLRYTADLFNISRIANAHMTF